MEDSSTWSVAQGSGAERPLPRGYVDRGYGITHSPGDLSLEHKYALRRSCLELHENLSYPGKV